MSVLTNDDLEQIYYAESRTFPNSLDGLRAVADAAVQAEREGQEAVAEVSRESFSSDGTSDIMTRNLPIGTKLYTTPPAAPVVPEDVAKDAERYRWLKSRMVGANFDWDGEGMVTLAFEMPEGCAFCADCDQNVDAAMLAASKPDAHDWNCPSFFAGISDEARDELYALERQARTGASR